MGGCPNGVSAWSTRTCLEIIVRVKSYGSLASFPRNLDCLCSSQTWSNLASGYLDLQSRLRCVHFIVVFLINS